MGENIGLWAHWLSDSQWGWEEMQVESRSIWCGAWSSLCWCVSEELHTPKDRREEVEQGKSQRPNPMSPSVSAKQMPYCPQSLLWPHFIFHLPLEWNRLPHALSGFNGRQRWGQVVQCMDPSVSQRTRCINILVVHKPDADPEIRACGGGPECVCARSCPTHCNSRLLCSWDFPSKSTGVGCYFLLQGILANIYWALTLQLEFKFWFCHTLPVTCWVNDLNFLCLGFLLYKW